MLTLIIIACTWTSRIKGQAAEVFTAVPGDIKAYPGQDVSFLWHIAKEYTNYTSASFIYPSDTIADYNGISWSDGYFYGGIFGGRHLKGLRWNSSVIGFRINDVTDSHTLGPFLITLCYGEQCRRNSNAKLIFRDRPDTSTYTEGASTSQSTLIGGDAHHVTEIVNGDAKSRNTRSYRPATEQGSADGKNLPGILDLPPSQQIGILVGFVSLLVLLVILTVYTVKHRKRRTRTSEPVHKSPDVDDQPVAHPPTDEYRVTSGAYEEIPEEFPYDYIASVDARPIPQNSIKAIKDCSSITQGDVRFKKRQNGYLNLPHCQADSKSCYNNIYSDAASAKAPGLFERNLFLNLKTNDRRQVTGGKTDTSEADVHTWPINQSNTEIPDQYISTDVSCDRKHVVDQYITAIGRLSDIR